jgi:hypothetical protein
VASFLHGFRVDAHIQFLSVFQAFNADSTHMNAAFVMHFEQAVVGSGYNLDLLHQGIFSVEAPLVNCCRILPFLSLEGSGRLVGLVRTLSKLRKWSDHTSNECEMW